MKWFTKYSRKSTHELMLMAYGAKSLWMIVRPEQYGFQGLREKELLGAADRASRELRKIFHQEPLPPWAARRGRRFGDIHRLSGQEKDDC